MAVASRKSARSKRTSILARLLGNGDGDMPPEVARYVLTLGFDADDKARVNDLVVRNQDGELSHAEWDELLDYLKADAILGTLKSKARLLLKRKSAKRGPA